MSRRSGVLALTIVCLGIILLAAPPDAAGQLTIVNPQNIDVPQQTAELLLRMSCRVAAEEFHARGEVEFPLTLVLGDDVDEHFTADDAHSVYAIYLHRWSESRFAEVTTLLAVRRLALPAQRKIVAETLKRARSLMPVRVEQLRRHQAPGEKQQASGERQQPTGE